MNESLPRYELFSNHDIDRQDGRWRFLLRRTDAPEEFEATDIEANVRGQRLELLAIVRGLEALEQPSAVTLMTASCSVREGISYGLKLWRENDWRWERFGDLVPVKNRDLWQRVDRALGFHKIDCHTWRIDSAHAPNLIPKRIVLREKKHYQAEPRLLYRLKSSLNRFAANFRSRFFLVLRSWKRQMAQTWVVLESF